MGPQLNSSSTQRERSLSLSLARGCPQRQPLVEDKCLAFHSVEGLARQEQFNQPLASPSSYLNHIKKSKWSIVLIFFKCDYKSTRVHDVTMKDLCQTGQTDRQTGLLHSPIWYFTALAHYLGWEIPDGIPRCASVIQSHSHSACKASNTNEAVGQPWLPLLHISSSTSPMCMCVCVCKYTPICPIL